MKQIPLLIALVFALSFCNLSEKLTGKKSDQANSNSNTSSSSDSSGSEKVEKPQPTEAQRAALEGGQTAMWSQQGISWTVPAKWKQMDVSEKSFSWGSGDGAFMNGSISALDDKFPAEISLKSTYEQYLSQQKNRELDEVKYLELDGVKGVLSREVTPEKQDDIRRIRWMGYRKSSGQLQLINLILSTNAKDFARHQDTLYAILYSSKIPH